MRIASSRLSASRRSAPGCLIRRNRYAEIDYADITGGFIIAALRNARRTGTCPGDWNRERLCEICTYNLSRNWGNN
jgi:hypothetical protein